MSGNIDTFNDDTWDQEVLKSDKPVLIDFWAEWCQPCRMIAPIVEALAEEYGGRIKVGKLDVDQNTAVSGQYQIRGIPTLLLIKDGEVKEQVVGLTTKERLAGLIEKHLS